MWNFNMKNNKNLIISLIGIVIVIGVVIALSSQSSQTTKNSQSESSETSQIERFSKPSDIKISSEKINGYLFWGDGCGYCAQMKKFLEGINDEYSKYYNLYMFEVYGSETNAKLMSEMAEVLNYNATGVPFLVIGDKPFSGYDSSMEQSIKDAIKSQYEERDQPNAVTEFIQSREL